MLLLILFALLAGAAAFLLFMFATVVDGTNTPFGSLSPSSPSSRRFVLLYFRLISLFAPVGSGALIPLVVGWRCRGLDARVARPAAAGEGGRQGELFLEGPTDLRGARVLDLVRFGLHIDAAVLLSVSWLPCRSCGLLERAVGLVSLDYCFWSIFSTRFSYDLLASWYHAELLV